MTTIVIFPKKGTIEGKNYYTNLFRSKCSLTTKTTPPPPPQKKKFKAVS